MTIYPDLWLSDPEEILKVRKEDRDRRNKQLKKKRDKVKREKKGSQHFNNSSPPVSSTCQPISSTHTQQRKQRPPEELMQDEGYRTRSKKRLPSNSTIQSNDKSTNKTPKRRHHPSLRCIILKQRCVLIMIDISTGKHTGANPDKEVNSHIYGTDVLLVTFCDEGDGMDYHLIRASHKTDPETRQIQDYTMSQKSTINNMKRNKVNPKLELVKTVKLDNSSLYIHTAHDDEVYSHALEYAEEVAKAKTNRVR